MKLFFVLLTFFLSIHGYSQSTGLPAERWADSVFHTLNRNKQIAQLMIVRAHSNLGEDHVKSVSKLVKKYKV
jgi:hypothetical protein